MLKPVSPQIHFPDLEEEILSFWKSNKIFEKSVDIRPADNPWTFLDGPPFVTGMPHYGSLLSSLPKDVFGRYYTMKGYRVRRVWGWDGHGLPIENKVENQLQIKRKKDIEEVVGVKKFVDECKNWVNQISGEWEWYIDHIGRWVDFTHAYKTWDKPYMESVMWVFSELYKKGLIYKGLRVSLYCPHCSTPISNFEVAMDADNYKDVTDFGTTYKFPLEGEENTFILAWSTTPWNKIVTVALAVNPKLTYIKVKQGNEYYILAEDTLKTLGDTPFEVMEKIPGSNLVGKKYTPHYDYFRNKVQQGEKVFEIIPGDFVEAAEGTGVVTIAAYGEEDLKVMKEQGIYVALHVDDEGHILPEVPQFGGMYYLKANKAVDEDLESRGLIYKREAYTHSVAHCWRCGTQLYYAPQNAWYVDVQSLKGKLKDINESINWFPKHFKYGRFLKSLENAPDWCISRNRYWGSPVPVWEHVHTDGSVERFVPGSIAELQERSGQQVTDLHKPEIDEIVVPSAKDPSIKLKRVPEVLDSWIEAGSASFGERHFPFNKELGTDFVKDFQPDFVAEYTGQIRAWFYVLHVIAGALYDVPAFKNVLVEGVILGTDGRKMSKNFKNYPDPKEMLGKYGGDALRLYLMSTPVMHGEDIKISEEDYKQQVRGLMLTLWNVYNFFVTNANNDGWSGYDDSLKNKKKDVEYAILDVWISALLDDTILKVTQSLDNYDTVGAIQSLQFFVNELSTWYIRRSRDRVGPQATRETHIEFYNTLYLTLTTFCRLLAPVAPFISEAIYKNITGEESVHLEMWPRPLPSPDDYIKGELDRMTIVRKAVEAAHSARKASGIKVRQPLAHVELTIEEGEPVILKGLYTSLIKDELNVESVTFTKGATYSAIFDTQLTPELILKGEYRELIRTIQGKRKELGMHIADTINLTIPDKFKVFENEITKKIAIKQLEYGDELIITKA